MGHYGKSCLLAFWATLSQGKCLLMEEHRGVGWYLYGPSVWMCVVPGVVCGVRVAGGGCGSAVVIA
jgi:hypothetical protein